MHPRSSSRTPRPGARLARRFLADRSGQVLPMAMMGIFLLVGFAAVAVDYANISTTKTWAYRTASDAALQGVHAGRTFADANGDYLTAYGFPIIDGSTAASVALAAVNSSAAGRRMAAGSVTTRIGVRPTGPAADPAIPGFPSSPYSSEAGTLPGAWVSEGPAVGVELTVQVPTWFFGMVNGASSVTVHAFGAAGLCGVEIPCRPLQAAVPAPPPTPLPTPTPNPTPVPIAQSCPPGLPYADAFANLRPSQTPRCWTVQSGTWGGSQ
jgi:hypothetical protein